MAAPVGGDRVRVWSGGSESASEVNPSAIAAMAEIGIDIAHEFPKPWTGRGRARSRCRRVVGCGDACAFYPRKRDEDRELADPAGAGSTELRPIRDQIRARVERLLAELIVAK